MQIQDINKRRNELLKRNAIQFTIVHEGSGTPSRMEIRRTLSAKLDVNEELIYLTQMQTKKGSMITTGEANVYDTVEQATFMEPEHIKLRNAPKTEKKE